MLDRALRILRPQPESLRLNWLNPDLAVGYVSNAEAWPKVYEAGVRGVVDIGPPSDAIGSGVRTSFIRYLNLAAPEALFLDVEDLHVVTRWVLERVGLDGRVLVQDRHNRFNDGLVAAATLIRDGLPSYLALIALQRAQPHRALSAEQNRVLVQFATGLHAETLGALPPSEGPSSEPAR